MDIPGEIGSSSEIQKTALPLWKFSKTIALTYIGLGFWILVLLFTGVYDLSKVVAAHVPLLLIPCALLVGLALGLIYVISALHQRRAWARYAAIIFWGICLAWSAFTIVRNGRHPEPASGPFQYSNANQLAGARFAALMMPLFLAAVELTAIYCLVQKASVVNQFKGVAERN